MPMPAPMPKMPESTPIMTLTRSFGSSSRTMPIERGRTAPAAPCRILPTTITPRLVARPATIVPTRRRLITTISMRRLPHMSPMRPKIGVSTEADSRYAVMIQLTSAVEACRSCPMVARAGATSDCSTA